jgi:carbonic anhydrase
MTTLRVVWRHTVLSLSLASAAWIVHARDSDDTRTSKNSRPEKSAPTEAVDPMDMLRVKLAAKLAGRDNELKDVEKSASAAPRSSAKMQADRVREKIASRLGGEITAQDQTLSTDSVIRVAARPTSIQTSTPKITPKIIALRPNIKVKRTHVSASRVIGASAEHIAKLGANDDHLHQMLTWNYQGDKGPEAWAQMSPEFATCAKGKRQSPIDIREGLKVDLEPIAFDYKPTSFRVIDNGHTVQVNLAAGNFIDVGGKRFELQQFHFHRPSEERINGKQFDMVAHLVHKDMEGKLAVIAVLLDRGVPHPVVQTVWNNLPLEKGQEFSARGSLDLNGLLPVDRSYFTYMGSLTTPPCSEGVLWLVMKSPVSVAQEQIHIFSRMYPMNARPTQAVAGRVIKESN